jgi:hypothetical protein
MNYAEDERVSHNADLLAWVLSRCERQASGCLDWLGANQGNGYGSIQIEGKQWLVHRLVWTLVHGAIPDGLNCLHSCDRPICCEVTHLSVGTQRENLDQMVARGRKARGSATGVAKLIPFQVWQIRKIIALGRFSNEEIGEMFGVDKATIHHIRVGRTWAWLRENSFVPINHLVPPLTFRRRI